MICQRIGRPPISTIGFGRYSVSSRNRVPSPPARIATFMDYDSRALAWTTYPPAIRSGGVTHGDDQARQDNGQQRHGDRVERRTGAVRLIGGGGGIKQPEGEVGLDLRHLFALHLLGLQLVELGAQDRVGGASRLPLQRLDRRRGAVNLALAQQVAQIVNVVAKNPVRVLASARLEIKRDIPSGGRIVAVEAFLQCAINGPVRILRL